MEMTFEQANELIFIEKDEHGAPAFLSKLKTQSEKSPGSPDYAAIMKRKLWIFGWNSHEIEEAVARMKQNQQKLMEKIYSQEDPRRVAG